MEPIDNNKINQILELTQENNLVLKRLLRAQLIQSWIRGIYIFIMIAFVYGGYVVLKPMLSGLIDTYQNILNPGGSITETVGQNQLQELLKSVQ
jgi:hypothetical protein